MAMGTATRRAAEKKKDKANNPSPVRSIAEGNAIARAGGVKAQFKQSEVTNAEGNKVYSTKPVSAGGSQFDVLANANKTRAGTTDRQIVQAQIDREKLKKQMEAEQTVANATPEQIAQVGQLNTEQNIFANPQDNEMPKGNPDMEDILRTAGERAATGATKGALGVGAAGFAAGSVIPVLGNMAGASIGIAAGGLGGGIMGAVTGTLQEYNEQSANDISAVDSNSKTASAIMDDAIVKANRAGGDPIQLTRNFNQAKAAYLRAQKQMQYISIHDKRGDEKATVKKIEMEHFIEYDLPAMENAMKAAILKPNPAYAQGIQYDQPTQ